MATDVIRSTAEVKSLQAGWAVADALLGGTPTMRDAGTTYLPKWPNEESEAYQARLDTATLFPAYRRTVGVMAGKPFSKELTLSDDTPAQIKAWAQDIDQQGVGLHSFAAEMFWRTVGYGLSGVLVDYPAVEPKAGRTVAQVEASGARPYFVRVLPHQILGWKSNVVAGRMMLTQLRLMETFEEDDGRFATKVVPQVRVLEPGRWEIWRKVGDDWTIVEAGTTTLDIIPFVPFYGERTGFMVGEMPLRDLAYLNIKHWQSQSDQDTILHVARVPILAMIGADDDTELTVGASSAVKLPQGAEMKFVEHTGAAIEAGATSLAALEDQMVQTGAELLVQKPGQRTATESANDAEGNKSDLQRMAENFEDSLDQALWLMSQYAGLPTGGKVSLFKDYGAATLSDASAQLVANLGMQGFITKQTVINEMKRRSVLSPDTDAEAELEAVALEGPSLAEVK